MYPHNNSVCKSEYPTSQKFHRGALHTFVSQIFFLKFLYSINVHFIIKYMALFNKHYFLEPILFLSLVCLFILSFSLSFNIHICSIHSGSGTLDMVFKIQLIAGKDKILH